MGMPACRRCPFSLAASRLPIGEVSNPLHGSSTKEKLKPVMGPERPPPKRAAVPCPFFIVHHASRLWDERRRGPIWKEPESEEMLDRIRPFSFTACNHKFLSSRWKWDALMGAPARPPIAGDESALLRGLEGGNIKAGRERINWRESQRRVWAMIDQSQHGPGAIRGW